MAYYHGIKTSEQATALATPAAVSVGITFAVGTAVPGVNHDCVFTFFR